MTVQDSDAFANALLDWIGDHYDGATVQGRTGAPAGPNNAAAGTLLWELTAPTPSMATASGRQALKTGTWQDPVANALGTAGHFRIIAASGRIWEGTITVTGGGGDMTVNVISVNPGDIVTITGLTLTH